MHFGREYFPPGGDRGKRKRSSLPREWGPMRVLRLLGDPLLRYPRYDMCINFAFLTEEPPSAPRRAPRPLGTGPFHCTLAPARLLGRESGFGSAARGKGKGPKGGWGLHMPRLIINPAACPSHVFTAYFGRCGFVEEGRWVVIVVVISKRARKTGRC